MKTVEEFLEAALGGNMNITTLKPLAWHEIMTDYAKHYQNSATSELKKENEALKESRIKVADNICSMMDRQKLVEQSRDELLKWCKKHRQKFPYVIEKWWIGKIDRLIKKAEQQQKEETK